MPVGLITSVLDEIMNGPEGGKYASLTIAGLDPRDPSKIYGDDSLSGIDFRERALQYWPETLSDSIDLGWEFKNVGGGSHALAQWGSNGGRTLTFDVQLSRYMMPVDSRSTKERILAKLTHPEDEYPSDNRPYNVDINDQIRFLRGFCYPTYLNIEGVVSALPPPVMMMCAPNMQLNEDGSDVIYCIMTGCDITYTLLFRDGTPRRATVSLTLRQVIQTNKGVLFVGFGEDAPSMFTMQTGEGINRSAGRDTNKIVP